MRITVLPIEVGALEKVLKDLDWISLAHWVLWYIKHCRFLILNPVYTNISNIHKLLKHIFVDNIFK